MYNIRREGRYDFLLGCSVPTLELAQFWFNYYKVKYPQYKFTIHETIYRGEMSGVTVDQVLWK